MRDLYSDQSVLSDLLDRQAPGRQWSEQLARTCFGSALRCEGWQRCSMSCHYRRVVAPWAGSQVRTGLSAGGNRIRTLGPVRYLAGGSAEVSIIVIRPRRLGAAAPAPPPGASRDGR